MKPPLVLAPLFLAMALLAPPLRATWSIILVDTRTGEIAIASATCLTGFDLQLNACVIVVGRGAAAAQSYIDLTGQNRQLLFRELGLGTPPAQILAMLAASDPGHQSRQYGIVDVTGRAVGFTGSIAGPWAGHLTGSVGTLVYAIQGNVLTGQLVLAAAELAIRTTPGDVAEKLMAAMEAARAMGGDGRCSCSSANPPGCGSPPPSFVKSAHIGYMLIARPGDLDGSCSAANGCANGSYYLDLNVANQNASDPDPVYQLRSAFLNFRLGQVLRPDHFRSEVSMDPPTLLADGRTSTTVTVVLRDWRGARLPWGGASVRVSLDPASTAAVSIGTVADHGDGSYSFPVTAGTAAGDALLRVTADDGRGPVLLSPLPVVRVTGDSLWLDRSSIEASRGGTMTFTIAAGPPRAGRTALLLFSASGTTPGVPLSPGLVLPLNVDPWVRLGLDLASRNAMPGLWSVLDARGWQQTSVLVPAGALSSLRQGVLHFAGVSFPPLDFATNPVPLLIR